MPCSMSLWETLKHHFMCILCTQLNLEQTSKPAYRSRIYNNKILSPRWWDPLCVSFWPLPFPHTSPSSSSETAPSASSPLLWAHCNRKRPHHELEAAEWAVSADISLQGCPAQVTSWLADHQNRLLPVVRRQQKTGFVLFYYEKYKEMILVFMGV